MMDDDNDTDNDKFGRDQRDKARAMQQAADAERNRKQAENAAAEKARADDAAKATAKAEADRMRARQSQAMSVSPTSMEEDAQMGALKESDIEAEIKQKALNEHRLTPALIDAAIVKEDFYVFPGTTMTVCLLTLRNGFHVVGHSSPVSPGNFDVGLGRKISRDNARREIWALEGYLMRARLAV